MSVTSGFSRFKLETEKKEKSCYIRGGKSGKAVTSGERRGEGSYIWGSKREKQLNTGEGKRNRG